MNIWIGVQCLFIRHTFQCMLDLFDKPDLTQIFCTCIYYKFDHQGLRKKGGKLFYFCVLLISFWFKFNFILYPLLYMFFKICPLVLYTVYSKIKFDKWNEARSQRNLRGKACALRPPTAPPTSSHPAAFLFCPLQSFPPCSGSVSVGFRKS